MTWKVKVEAPPDFNRTTTDADMLEVFTQCYADKAADVLRAHLDSAGIKGPASSRAAIDELIGAVTGRLIGSLLRDHWDCKYVRALFPEGADTPPIQVTCTMPPYETVSEIVRDERGRASKLKTTRKVAS